VTSKISEASALLSAGAVRAAADDMFARAQSGALPWWSLDLAKLPACADFVAKTIRERYPSLEIPFHARWRHFVFNGRDLWADIARGAAWRDADARARAEFDLAITSVLLDAGAGAAWRYRDLATDIEAVRSEGLALASLRLFEWGGFSADPSDPLRADAAGLKRLDAAALSDAFQVSAKNPLLGLEGRAALLNRLGAQSEARPDLFALAEKPRPGGLYDVLKAKAIGGELQAPAILEALLEGLGPIWENRPSLDGAALGDCWPVEGVGFVPLHKLSQWLAYSLIEPLEAAGIRVVNVDGLTGLAEYRNGGLFVDAGVLVPREADALAKTYQVSDPFVVSWRSLTVALLDRIAPLVRERLGVAAEDFPLARVLEGGTWAAGRILARERRSDSGPPFSIISDGTVF
jgi:hypothetical protein